MITDPIFYRLFELPRLNREEIQKMLQIHDIRESRVYQEAMEEGIEKGRAEGIEKGIAIAQLAAGKKSAAEIAALLDVDVELVRQALAKANQN